MQHIGILIEELDCSQKSLLIKQELETLSELRPNLNITIYYQLNNIFPVYVNIGMMQNIHAWGFKGHFIALDFASALSMIPLNNTGKKIYYPLQLDWLVKPDFANNYHQIYNNDQIELIARSQNYYDVLNKVWKKPLCTIEDLNHEKLTVFIDRSCV